jgi:hypothetical protein
MSEEPTAAEAEEMTKYGIERRIIEYYHFKDYRYTSVKDALAAGRRQSRAG